MNVTRSQQLFAEALTLLPGGVDSPVRAFRAVGGQPLFIERGEGAYLYDVDGNRFWDTAKVADRRKYAAFFQTLVEHGVYLAPSQFEAEFMSAAHNEAEIAATIEAARHAFRALD
jgi:glutamate-1-semialdehyde aminotransferase